VHNTSQRCTFQTLGFRRGVVQVFALLGCYTRRRLVIGIDVSGKPNVPILSGKEAQEDGIDKFLRNVAIQLPTHPRRGRASLPVQGCTFTLPNEQETG